MHIYKKFIILLFTLTISSGIFCQTPDNDSATQKFNIPSSNFTERLEIRTDKDVYVSGESLWLRIWSFDNMYDKPLSLSKIAYIELLNPQNVPVIRQKARFTGSGLNNVLPIPVSLSSGNYTIRAYTQWMRNFDPRLFCYKEVTIINPSENIDKLIYSGPDTLAKNPGLSILKVSGVSMQITENTDSVIVKILNPGIPSLEKEITVLSSGGGKVINHGSHTLNGSDEVGILKNRLSEGANAIYIFGTKGGLLCRGNIYIAPGKEYSFRIAAEDTVFRTRKKVAIELFPDSLTEENLKTDLSVSVTRKIPFRKRKGPDDNYDSRFREISAGASLIGKVGQDTGKYPYEPEIYGICISGRAYTKNPKEPAGNIPLSLSFPGKEFQGWFTVSESDGRFGFILNDYRGEKEIILSSATREPEDLLFEIDDPFSNQFSENNETPFSFDKSLVEYIEKAWINLQINREVELNKPTENKILTRGCFYGKPDIVFELDKYIKIPTVTELISDLLPMVSVRKRDNRNQVVILGMAGQNRNYVDVLGYNPLMLIDGVPVFDSDLFLQTNVPDIERIEILYSQYLFGNIVFDGVINLITRKGNCDIDFSDKKIRMTYQFPEPDKYFKNTDYSSPGLFISRVPDFRTTLYWNPGIVAGKDGRAKIEFYTSDDTGEYDIIVEGYTANGVRIKETRTIIVTK